MALVLGHRHRFFASFYKKNSDGKELHHLGMINYQANYKFFDQENGINNPTTFFATVFDSSMEHADAPIGKLYCSGMYSLGTICMDIGICAEIGLLGLRDLVDSPLSEKSTSTSILHK